MAQINDAIRAATGNTTVNDGLLAFYKANGAVSNDLQDAEREFLIAVKPLIVKGSLQDMWYEYFTVDKLYTGALDDMRLVYWTTGPRP